MNARAILPCLILTHSLLYLAYSISTTSPISSALPTSLPRPLPLPHLFPLHLTLTHLGDFLYQLSYFILKLNLLKNMQDNLSKNAQFFHVFLIAPCAFSNQFLWLAAFFFVVLASISCSRIHTLILITLRRYLACKGIFDDNPTSRVSLQLN